MTALTADLGRFLESVRFDSVPADAWPLVRHAFTDTLGVMMAGLAEPVVDIVARTLIQRGAQREARACLSSAKVWAPDAALLGGTAAHALDYDDQSLSGHPSAVLVPAILAEGERLGASGRELATAYVAGYEVWAELVQRANGYHRRGWHPTAVFGVIGSAAAVAVLNRLPAERAAMAMALAATHSGGLSANFGTMAKAYHAGRAARDGIVATRLAAAGTTASGDTLENVQGFLTAFSSAGADRASPSRLGDEWYLVRQRLCIKKYPTCYFMHRSFDAVVKMLAGRSLGADDIDEIEVTMGKGQTAVLTFDRPQTALQAKFSEQFAMAAAVVLGRMGIADLADPVVQRRDIQAFFPKVKLNGVDEYDDRDPAHSPTERVRVTLARGEILDSGPIASVRGHAYDPMSTEELWTKFAECTAQAYAPREARHAFDLLQAVDAMPSAHALPSCKAILLD